MVQSFLIWNLKPIKCAKILNREKAGFDTPNPKPLEMMKYFIATYSDENDYVLDNTMGVGTTCLGAKS